MSCHELCFYVLVCFALTGESISIVGIPLKDDYGRVSVLVKTIFFPHVSVKECDEFMNASTYIVALDIGYWIWMRIRYIYLCAFCVVLFFSHIHIYHLFLDCIVLFFPTEDGAVDLMKKRKRTFEERMEIKAQSKKKAALNKEKAVKESQETTMIAPEEKTEQ